MEKKDKTDNDENNIEIKNEKEENKNENKSENSLKDFYFILNRSKNIKKIIEIDNPVKIIDYTYTREEPYSDEILYYLTQLNDKINQYKYNTSLNKSNNNSNFHIYNLNYTTEIDTFFQYELFKDEIYNNSKSYNVHDHRKVPFELDIKGGKRRNNQNFKNLNNKNNYFKKINDNRRSVSIDKFNKKSFKNNYITDIEKNKDKIFDGGKEFKNNNNVEIEDDDSDKSMDNANGRYTIRYKKRKEYCEGLTTYDPFKKKKKKKYKEDNYYN